jgi:uncharacterized protein YidB (DUF937 family)
VEIMGILNSIESMADSASNNNSKVAGGLMQALDEHPGGLAGVLDSLRQNGMQQHVQSWATGQQQTATPQQIHQGLGGTGLIDRVAAKVGVSPEVAETALASVLPMVIAHFTKGGETMPPQSGFGGMASQILGKFL